ncbi:MAG: hypothetical protein ACYC7L_14495, partial [Nitrospirota bacterium]
SALKVRLPESGRPVKYFRQNEHFFLHDKERETLNSSRCLNLDLSSYSSFDSIVPFFLVTPA